MKSLMVAAAGVVLLVALCVACGSVARHGATYAGVQMSGDLAERAALAEYETARARALERAPEKSVVDTRAEDARMAYTIQMMQRTRQQPPR